MKGGRRPNVGLRQQGFNTPHSGALKALKDPSLVLNR